MNPLRIGILGAGAKAAEHAAWFHGCDATSVAAVFDPDAERAETLAEACEARVFTRFEPVLKEVDAVVIASPNRFHKEQAIACANAGLHVYCEKPVGLCGADAEEMADAVDAAGVMSAVGFTNRHHPTIQTLQRLVREGFLGDLVSIWSRRLFSMDPASLSGWRADQAESGGLLLEVNVHEIDWMMMLGGPVASVYAQSASTVTRGSGANDHLWVTLNFAGGAHGQHEGSWSSAMPSFFRGAHGTRGGAQTDEWGASLLASTLGGERAPVELDPALDLRREFVDAVRWNRSIACDMRWGAGVMAVADAIFASARSNRVVSLAGSGVGGGIRGGARSGGTGEGVPAAGGGGVSGFLLGHHAMTWEGWWKQHEQAFDLDTLLREVKAAGYDAIEMSGSEETLGPAAGLRKKLDDHGLAVAAWSAEVTANPWEPNRIAYERDLDYAAELGARTIAVCGGFLGRRFRTVFGSDFDLFARNLQAATDHAAKNGQALCFHPHCGCMVETGEELDRLSERLPHLPVLVDTGHLVAVRTDPVALIRRLGPRVAHVHLKDWDPGAGRFTEIGKGAAGLDFQAVFDALDGVGYRGAVVVERDSPRVPPLQSARMSRQRLAALRSAGSVPAA